MLVRYCLVGGGATAIHSLVLLFLVEAMHVHPAPACALGAGVGAVSAYWIVGWLADPPFARNAAALGLEIAE